MNIEYGEQRVMTCPVEARFAGYFYDTMG